MGSSKGRSRPHNTAQVNLSLAKLKLYLNASKALKFKVYALKFIFCFQGEGYPPRQLNRPVLVQIARRVVLVVYS